MDISLLKLFRSEVFPPRPIKMPNRNMLFRSRFYSSITSPVTVSAPSSVTCPVTVSAPSSVTCPVTVSAPSSVTCPVTVSAPFSVTCPVTVSAPSSVTCPVTATSVQPGIFTSECPTSLKQRREQLVHLAKESVKDNSVALLKLIGSGNWSEMVALSEELKPFIPEFPASLSKEWHVPTLLDTNKRYKDYIPRSIGERKCMATTSNGNCIFNAFSIALYGSEDHAFLLRLASVVMNADNTLQYSKYIAETFGKESTTCTWISSFAGTEYSVPDDLSEEEKVEFVCQQEMLLTARMPYRDCNLINMHMLTEVLKRAAVNHYPKKDFAVPFMENLFPVFASNLHPESVHIVWVPTKPSRYASIKHVVPAVCQPGIFGTHVDECAFEGLACCTLMENANPFCQDTDMVECTICGQWVHAICMRIDTAHVKEDDKFSCGCDLLVDGKFEISSKEWYISLTIDLCKSLVDFKDVVEDTTPSFRNYIYRHPGFIMTRRRLRLGRFGPFQEAIIDTILEELASYVDVKEQALVPDIFLPEVLLRLVQKKEKVNRLLAEKILVDIDAEC